MGYQTYSAPMAQPAEVQSIKSMLHIARILAVIFGILALLGGIAYVAYIAYLSSVCSTFVGFDPYCGSAVASALVGAVYLVLAGVFAIIVYMQMKSIESKVDAHQYEQAKGQTLIWMILGFIFGVILGIILLVAYLKFDPLINWSRGGGATAPTYSAPFPPPAPIAAPPPVAAAPPPSPAQAAAPTTPCPRCGKPATWVPQYNRWYCTAEQQYL